MKHNQIFTILLCALCTGLLCLALSSGPSVAKTSQRQSNLVARDSGRSVFSQSSTAQNQTRSNAERENQNGLQKTNLTQTPASDNMWAQIGTKFPRTTLDPIDSANATGKAGGTFATTLEDHQTTYRKSIINQPSETQLASAGNALVASSKGKLSLFVRDGITGYGVKSEILFSSSKDSYLLSTDEGGILEFVAERGRFDLTINTPGYKQMKTFFSITPDEEMKTNIWLDRESNQDLTEAENESSTAVIRGYVVDGGSGKPIEGVNVYFTTIDKHIKTNRNGYFRIESETVSKLEGDQDDNQRRVNIEFTKESFRDYVIENFLLVKGVITLRITLEKGQDKVIENYFQSILDKQNENTDINEQPGSNQEQNFYGNEEKSDGSSLQSCPTLPTTIRVGTGCPTSGGNPICNQVCTGTVQVMSLESYVQSGLDNEWISSWLPASLQAGAVAYRTYGAYFVINQPLGNPNYDIRSDTCNQAWGSATATSCVSAANATVGEVIVNSSSVIVKSEYSAENNNAGCGDGFSGTGGTWPCISDNVCSGFPKNGHGNGMCQYGSSRWAAQGQTYTWILDHYYNPGNYFRCGSTGVTPPLNDNCSNATVLTSSTSCTYTSGTVLNATPSGLSKPSCDAFSNPNMHDVWYKFTAISSSQTVTVDPTTAIGDPVVSIYGSCSGSPIRCSDGGPGVTENLSLSGLTVGNTYYVRIYDYGSVEPTGADANFQICVTGTTATPTITVSTTSLSSFGNVEVGQNSAPQSYTVSGSNLSANISIQAPTGFRISLNSTSGFTNTLNLTQSGGSVPTTTIYARFSPQTSGAQIGSISHTSSGATTKNISVSGTGTSQCTYSISESEHTVSPGSVSVNFFMDAPSGCDWTAVSDSQSWLTTSSSGSGDGTINYKTAVNPSSNSRVGHITVGGQVHTVTQIGVGGAGNVRFSSVTYTSNEGGGDATITVTRTGGTGTGTVQYSTLNGTATAGTDYISASGTLLFVGDETSKSFSVTTLDDTTFEGNESFSLLLNNNSSSLTLGNPSTATLMIIDNDSSPDSNGPNLSINSHSNGQIVSSSAVTLFGTASDSGRGNSGISSVTVNGVGASGGTASGSGTANWSRSLTLSQGANNITVVARDNSSNQNSTTQSITLNYQPVQNYTIAISASPSAGGTVSGGGTFAAGSSRTVTATANTGYSFANWTENGSMVSSAASYTFTLNGNRTLVANFSIVSSSNAVYDSTLKAPKCSLPGSVCDSGTLLNGRGNMTDGAEPNQPNTIYESCLDGTSGTYHDDESIDKIRVSTLDGSNFAPGKTVKIEVTVWVFGSDHLDLYYAADATNPSFSYIATLEPSPTSGAQVLSTTFTLPSGGSLQAVRAHFRYEGEASVCGTSKYDDHDDLVFAAITGVAPGVTTTPATFVTGTAATLNGSVDPNGSTAKGWFEWGASPTLATYEAGPLLSLGSGSTAVPISIGVGGFNPGTTYYFRAAGSNAFGTRRGNILSFRTGAVPSLRVNSITVTEKNTGSNATAVFTVSMYPASSQTVTVKFATANGSAATPADYTARALSTLTFLPGQISKTVNVVVIGDAMDETNETFRLLLSSPTNATLAIG